MTTAPTTHPTAAPPDDARRPSPEFTALMDALDRFRDNTLRELAFATHDAAVLRGGGARGGGRH